MRRISGKPSAYNRHGILQDGGVNRGARSAVNYEHAIKMREILKRCARVSRQYANAEITPGRIRNKSQPRILSYYFCLYRRRLSIQIQPSPSLHPAPGRLRHFYRFETGSRRRIICLGSSFDLSRRVIVSLILDRVLIGRN